jgi:putative addiction module killer protein
MFFICFDINKLSRFKKVYGSESRFKHFISEVIHNNLDNLYLSRYIINCMKYELRSSKQYDKWFAKLKDSSIKIKVLARLDRVENGNFGDFKQIGSNLFELRFFFGSGLRIYYTIQESRVLFLLAGGDKSTQSKDIETAAELLNELEG